MKQLLCVLLSYALINTSYADSYTKLDDTNSAGVSTYGKLKIKGQFSDESVYYNGKKLKTPDDCSVFNIVGVSNIGGYITYNLWCGTGGTMDNDTNLHTFFVTIDGSNKAKLSSVLASGNYSVQNGQIMVKYHSDKPYSEENDYGLYSYNPATNQVTTISNIKSDKYYQNKYANYTVDQVISAIKSDECYDIENGRLAFSHFCGTYGAKYCFMFNAIKQPVKNKNYSLLNASCNSN